MDSSNLLSLSQSLADTVEKVGSSVVGINAGKRFSPSGIHWRQGIIITSDESLSQQEDISITLANGDKVAATMVGQDSSTDVAVFQIENLEMNIAAIGDATTLKVGHLVLGLARSREGDIRATMGMVSVVGDSWQSMNGGTIDQFIRPDITLYPGFVGGPLVDAGGFVVGMNTSGRRGTALTIPAATINRVVDQLLAKGRIARGYLGLGMQPVQLPGNLVSSLNLSGDGGVIVVSVEANAPAELGGVLLGDILVMFDNVRVSDTSDVLGVLNNSSSVDKVVSVQIIRGGALVNLTVSIGERPF